MRASGITTYGGPFEVFDVPEPAIEDDQVLVAVAAAGIGLWDAAVAAGLFGTDRTPPVVLGWEGSGVVVDVGSAVEDLEVGDHVIAYDRAGGWYAERVAVSATSAVRAPENLELVSAAALPVAGATAWQTLVHALDVRPGETVLITAAAGATGVLAVQLARHLGATVLATAGPDNLDFLADRGADEVFDYTHGIPAVLAALRRRHPGGVDALFDAVSADNFAALTAAVRPGGRAAGITPPLPPVHDGIAVHPIFSTGDRATLGQVVELVDKGVLTVALEDVLDLTATAEAHRKLATRHGRGKILLRPTG